MKSMQYIVNRLPIGEQLGYLEYTLTQKMLNLFSEAVGYPSASFPNIAALECLEVFRQKYDLPSAHNVAHTDRFYRPPVVGRRVQVSGWIRDRRQIRGAERITVATFAVDEIGAEILRSEHTLQVGEPGTPERLGRRPARRRNSSAEEELPTVEKRVTEEAIERFRELNHAMVGPDSTTAARIPAVNHAGAGLASGMGLTATVAHGELGLAYLHELLDRRFGIDFRQGGRLSINYRRPIYAGDSLSAHGIVTNKSLDGQRVDWQLQVWLENSRGELVITGDAQVTVPSPLT